MRSALQLLGGVAVAGVVATGSTAFTAAGLTNNAGSTQFVGGTVTQAVTGAALASITYSYSDAPANTRVVSIALAFTGTADARPVAVTPSGTGFAVGTDTLLCTAVSGNASTCTVRNVANSADSYYDGLTSLNVTVS